MEKVLFQFTSNKRAKRKAIALKNGGVTLLVCLAITPVLFISVLSYFLLFAGTFFIYAITLALSWNSVESYTVTPTRAFKTCTGKITTLTQLNQIKSVAIKKSLLDDFTYTLILKLKNNKVTRFKYLINPLDCYLYLNNCLSM